jgi:hypothetical protein
MEGLKRCVRAGSLTVEVTLGEYVFEKRNPFSPLASPKM